eukprot:Partr_v1_DN25087_c2_g1_i1_m50733 putative Adenylate cyclase
MEVEVKLRIASKEDHAKVEQCLKSEPFAVHRQENRFFDGDAGQLGATKSVMRVRTINEGFAYILTLKANSILRDGISRVEETEETLPPPLAQALLDDPNCISRMASQSPLLTLIMKRFDVTGNWKEIGRYQTIRKKFRWNELVLELDETMYSFGTAYEIEVETEQPEIVKLQLERLLRDNDIHFKNSGRNKFVNMIRGSIE